MQDRPTDASFEPLLCVEMDVADFLCDWLNCDQLSNHLAAMVSHDRGDPIRYANVLSSALNEVLEVSFRTPSNCGRLSCEISRSDDTDRIELTFPSPREQRRGYSEALSDMARGSALESYLKAISDDAPLDAKALILGLVTNYDAVIDVQTAAEGYLTLVVDLSVEGLLA